MIRRCTILIFLILTVSLYATPPQRPPLTVTYVANEGFLIACDSHKILIDALFGNFKDDAYYIPSDSTAALMSEAKPPFDNIDLIAVTHAHLDHFTPEIVTAHLKNDPRTILICPAQAEEKMKPLPDYEAVKNRIRAIAAPVDSFFTLEIAGIRVGIFPGHHGPYYDVDPKTGENVDRHRHVQHLEYMFSISGWNLFHCGDAPINDRNRYQSFNLSPGDIDIAFLGWWDARDRLSFRQQLIKDILRPDRVIMMHLSPSRPPLEKTGTADKTAREVTIPRQMMQQWIFE